MIKERLERNTKSVAEALAKKYEGYISPDDYGEKTAETTREIENLNAKLKEKENSIADLTAKNKAYETNSVKMRIAGEFNIPQELAERLSGETEDEIKADAQKVSRFFGKNKQMPLFSAEDNDNAADSAYKKLVSGFNE